MIYVDKSYSLEIILTIGRGNFYTTKLIKEKELEKIISYEWILKTEIYFLVYKNEIGI